jgi:hypothetical protein
VSANSQRQVADPGSADGVTITPGCRRAPARSIDYRAGEGLGGRFVPAEVIRAQADPEWGSRNRKTFEEVRHHFDSWHRFDNSGTVPVLVEARHREEDHEHE